MKFLLKNKAEIIFGILISAIALFQTTWDRFFFQQLMGLCFLCVYFTYRVSKIFGWQIAIPFLVPSVYGLIQIGLPGIFYNKTNPAILFHSLTQQGLSILTLLLFSITLIFLNFEISKKLIVLLSGLALINALVMMVKGIIWWSFSAFLIFGNGALDACFLAVMLPIAFAFASGERFKWYGRLSILILCGGIFATKASVGFGAIGIAFAAYLFSERGFKKSIPYILIMLGVSIALGKLWMGKELMHDNGRMIVWKEALTFFLRQDLPFRIFGIGPGSFFDLGPMMQVVEGSSDPTKRIDMYFWAHNDWLQVLFEWGFLGLSAVLIFFQRLLRNSYRNPILFSMVCTYGFVALAQFPAHEFIFQLLGIVIIFLACYEEAVSQISFNVDDLIPQTK